MCSAPFLKTAIFALVAIGAALPAPAFALGGDPPGFSGDRPVLSGHSARPYRNGRYNGYGVYGGYGWGYPYYGYTRYVGPEESDFDYGLGRGCAIERQRIHDAYGWRWGNVRRCY
jgi:hypothetical protein